MANLIGFKEALKRKHAWANTNKTEQASYLKAELNRLDKRIDALYNDKLDGKIPERLLATKTL